MKHLFHIITSYDIDHWKWNNLPIGLAAQSTSASAEEIFLSETNLDEASRQFGYEVKVTKYLPQNVELAYTYYKSSNDEKVSM